MTRFTHFPKLYKLDSKGKKRVWWGEVEEFGDGAAYHIHHGVEDGAIQKKTTQVPKGKNIGKANETTPLEQAVLELDSKYNRQEDKLYTENPSGMSNIFRPMLAHKASKYLHKISFPCYIQPKLDGLRCNVSKGPVFQSRQGKKWDSLTHLQDELFFVDDFILDGELYCDVIPFQEIVGSIKRDKPNNNTVHVEYHVYDLFYPKYPNMSFKERFAKLEDMAQNFGNKTKLVQTKLTEDGSEHAEFISNGYEGSILRNGGGKYKVDGRSYDLLKVKDFMDEEFVIVDGKLDKDGGCVFTCKTKDGTTFNVRPEGTLEFRRGYFDNIGSLIGKMLTVEFFEWTTSDNPVPRFPVGKCVRDYE